MGVLLPFTPFDVAACGRFPASSDFRRARGRDAQRMSFRPRFLEEIDAVGGIGRIIGKRFCLACATLAVRDPETKNGCAHLSLVFCLLLGLGHSSAARADAAPDYEVVLKPRLVGDRIESLQVTMTIPRVSAPAYRPFIAMRMIAYGVESARLDTAALRARDERGPLSLIQSEDPVDPAQTEYYRRWAADREVSGDVTLVYDVSPR